MLILMLDLIKKIKDLSRKKTWHLYCKAFQGFSRCKQTLHFWVEGSVGVKDFKRTFMAGENEFKKSG